MSTFVWPSEDGWPYPDTAREWADVDESDDDLLALRTDRAHLLSGLEPVERDVIAARFGLDGTPARSMRELHDQFGLSQGDLLTIMGSGLAKLRQRLA